MMALVSLPLWLPYASVPPTAHTSSRAAPQTSSKFGYPIVPTAAAFQIVPSTWKTPLLVPTAQTSFAAVPQMPRMLLPVGNAHCDHAVPSQCSTPPSPPAHTSAGPEPHTACSVHASVALGTPVQRCPSQCWILPPVAGK